MSRIAKRKCKLWISNNKVLVGGGKKPHARNPNFEADETKLLISLWGDPIVQKTLITTHKKHPVIQKIAVSLTELYIGENYFISLFKACPFNLICVRKALYFAYTGCVWQI